jgi:hypothetical protein
VPDRARQPAGRLGESHVDPVTQPIACLPRATVDALVAADGSAADAWARHLRDPRTPARDLADAVHALCALHGRHPGVVDHARAHAGDPAVEAWLASLAQVFAGERALIAQLAAAAGPLPSTPGQAESEAAVAAQRHALDTLAQSDRTGCALGAALALALDWPGVRAVLDAAAGRFGPDLPPLAMIDTDPPALSTPAAERALSFGAQQLLAQHRGLWQLLEARAHARDRD